MKTSLEKPLLDHNDSTFDEHDYDHSQRSQPRGRRYGWPFLVALIILNCLLLATSGFLFFLHKTKSGTNDVRCAIQAANSPAAHTLQYKKVLFHKYAHWTSPFSKKPGPEVDAAWHDQLEGMNIRVSKEWLEPYGAESVAFADGSGYLVQLAVYHELHCLKRLKHWMYRDHYFTNATQSALIEAESHAEHCLELLRSATLCRGDTTLTTFQWGGKGGKRLETEYPIPHQCVDSDMILEWSRKHVVDIADKSILTRPEQSVGRD